ncbi:MAG: ComF family protein [Clostridia bacterium]|nr:ComF family protein [Clostridia bacterium]
MTSDDKDKLKKEKREVCKKKIRDAIWRTKCFFEDALFPDDITCDICGEELTAYTRYKLCAECAFKIPFTGEHICLSCGVSMSDEADYCLRCENSDFKFMLNRAPMIYDGEAKSLIYAMKFGGKRYLAKTIGAMMADEFIKRKMSADIVMYVPMTEAEEKSRGFNQSELLAREVADRLNMPLLPALVKVKETSAQKHLTGKEREDNLDGAFVCTFNQVKGRRMLLIDDVFTTGATANACTKALLKAGAKDVRVLTAAVTKKKVPVESNDGETTI